MYSIAVSLVPTVYGVDGGLRTFFLFQLPATLYAGVNPTSFIPTQRGPNIFLASLCQRRHWRNCQLNAQWTLRIIVESDGHNGRSDHVRLHLVIQMNNVVLLDNESG